MGTSILGNLYSITKAQVGIHVDIYESTKFIFGWLLRPMYEDMAT